LWPVSDVPPEDPRNALIREQAQRIAALEAVVADLREQLAAAVRAGSRNSGNSSMPPSSDDLPGRKPSAQAAAGRGAGGGEEAEAGEAVRLAGRRDALGGPGPDRGPLPAGRAMPLLVSCELSFRQQAGVAGMMAVCIRGPG